MRYAVQDLLEDVVTIGSDLHPSDAAGAFQGVDDLEAEGITAEVETLDRLILEESSSKLLRSGLGEGIAREVEVGQRLVIPQSLTELLFLGKGYGGDSEHLGNPYVSQPRALQVESLNRSVPPENTAQDSYIYISLGGHCRRDLDGLLTCSGTVFKRK